MELSENILLQHKLFSFILNNSQDAVICCKSVKNKRGDIVDFKFDFINNSAFKYIGGKSVNYTGKTFLQLFPNALQNGMFDAFKGTAETGQPHEDSFYYENSKNKGWFRNSVINYNNGIIVFFRDETPQKSLEKEMKNQTQTLQKLLSEKEILLKETYHRVNNNLQLISSLLNLQSSSYYFESCTTCNRRIATMAMVHQNLYEEKDFRSVNIRKFINEIISLQKTYYNDNKDITFSCDIDDVRINLNYCINIGLIINELITNSIKHAFNGSPDGRINVEIKHTGRDLSLKVSDNGKGLPENFRLNRINTLGLTLVKTLTEQMDGQLKILKTPGTALCITLPEIVE